MKWGEKDDKCQKKLFKKKKFEITKLIFIFIFLLRSPHIQRVFNVYKKKVQQCLF